MIGNYFANCFIHFEPSEPIEGESSYNPELDLPPYLKTGSAWVEDWKNSHPKGWKGVSLCRGFATFEEGCNVFFLTICRSFLTELSEYKKCSSAFKRSEI
jgi:hypothetical protein